MNRNGTGVSSQSSTERSRGIGAAGGSLYLRAMQKRANAVGRSLTEQVEQDRLEAQTPLGLTDECLFPDEAHYLLDLGAVIVKSGTFKFNHSKEQTVLNAEQGLLLEHVRNCSFCQGMLVLMEPSTKAKDCVLKEVLKHEASTRTTQIPQQPNKLGSIWHCFKTAWPLFIPVAVLLAPLVLSLRTPTVVTEAIQASIILMLVAGALVGVIVFLFTRGEKKTSKKLGASLASRLSSTTPIFAASLSSAVALAVVGGVQSVKMDRAIYQAQKMMALSANNVFGGDPRQFTVVNDEGRKLEIQSLKLSPTLAAFSGKDKKFAGSIVAEVGTDHASIAWQVEGVKLRLMQLQLQSAQRAVQKEMSATAPKNDQNSTIDKADVVTVEYERPLLSTQRLDFNNEEAQFPFQSIVK